MSRVELSATVAQAANAVRARLDGQAPAVALILGSGLGELADAIARPTHIPYAEIPGFCPTSVPGHRGRLTVGTLDGCHVAALAGRFHLYEGHTPEEVALPVRMLHALGVRTLVVSNAAGAIRRKFRPGDLMLIHDHLNLIWRNPLIGPVREGEARFPDMSEPYDRSLLASLRAAVLQAGIPVVEGVYAAVPGPSYETPAEIRMLERLGADAVGMSTVPEVIVARALGIRVVGVSCITNAAAGIGRGALSHADVLSVAARAGSCFQKVVRTFLLTMGARNPGLERREQRAAARIPESSLTQRHAK